MHIDLGGKNAVVAGGAGAIGLAIAKALAEAGAKVTVFDIKLQSLTSPAGPASPASGISVGNSVCPEITGQEVDIADVDGIRTAIAGIDGGLDILVNAAGVNFNRPVGEVQEEDWDHVHSVNLKSCFFMAQAAVPQMKRRGGGSIIFVSSCSARLGYPGITDYCASKGGVNAMVRSLACDLAPSNIRVNAIAPGTIKTPMTRGLWAEPEKCAAHAATIPLGRLGDPREQGMAALFLASDMASYITGAILPVDGGLTAMQADFIDLRLRGW